MGERSSFWKRPREDNESAGPSDISKRKQEEDTTSTVFASGPSGRRSTLFRPIVQSQEQQKQHERTSEVPAWQQVGREDLLRLRSQIQQTNQFLQETHHRSQAVLEGLNQHIAQMQQQAGSSEVPVSTSHQQDTRALQTSLHPPARTEQSMLQHQQEEIFDIHDYLVDSPSDSDHESDQRELLQAHEAKGVAPIQSSTHHASDAQLQKSPLENLKQEVQIKQQQNTLVQQHEVYDQTGSSRQGDARPARTEKRKSHQTLSPKASKYQRQDTASSPELLDL